MDQDGILTLAQATTETPEAPAAVPEPADDPPPGDAATEVPEEGIVETIIDAVTDAVEEVVPGGEGEPAGAAEDQAEPADGAEEGADEGAEEGLIETIIDAVTDAVEEVVPGGEAEGPVTGEAVGVADEHGAAAEDHGVLGPEVWLVLALLVLIVIAFRPAKRAILGALDGRAGRIRDELEEAKRLREEAQAALANFQRRQRDALGEAEEIIAHARAEAERLREHAVADLEVTLKRREAMAMDRIAQAEAAATAEVRGIAVDAAIAAARDVIGSQLDKAKADALIDDAIKDLPNRVH